MPITTANIEVRPSINSGTRGNQTNQGNVNTSLGGYIATNDIVNATLDNLFSDLTGAENASGSVDYRCIFLLNNSNTNTWLNSYVYISGESTAVVQIGVDPSGISQVSTNLTQATIIPNAYIYPTGVVFSKPLTTGTALSIGNLVASGCQGIWLQRSGTNSAAMLDQCSLGFFGDTAS